MRWIEATEIAFADSGWIDRMHVNWFKYSSPASFYPLAGKLRPWFLGAAAILLPLALYQGLAGIPTLALRSDWKLLPFLLRHYPGAVVKFLGQLKAVGGAAGAIADQTVTDPWVRYLFELECFLLSGMSANDTVAPEMAVMFGERTGSVIDYPIGGSGAIVAA